MGRTILFQDGVFYDGQMNAITPTPDDLMDLAVAVFKYTEIGINEARKQPLSQ